MKKYLIVKDELEKVGISNVKISNEKEIKNYNNLLNAGEDLPENIFIKTYKDFYGNPAKDYHGNIRRDFYRRLTDKEIELRLELSNVKSWQTMATALKFFMILQIIMIVIGFIIGIIIISA